MGLALGWSRHWWSGPQVAARAAEQSQLRDQVAPRHSRVRWIGEGSSKRVIIWSEGVVWAGSDNGPTGLRRGERIYLEDGARSNQERRASGG